MLKIQLYKHLSNTTASDCKFCLLTPPPSTDYIPSVCSCVWVWWVKNIMTIYILVDLVKCGVLTLVGEIWYYRNHEMTAIISSSMISAGKKGYWCFPPFWMNSWTCSKFLLSVLCDGVPQLQSFPVWSLEQVTTTLVRIQPYMYFSHTVRNSALFLSAFAVHSSSFLPPPPPPHTHTHTHILKHKTSTSELEFYFRFNDLCFVLIAPSWITGC